MSTTTAAYAARYIERFGLALVPLHGKAPYSEAWNAEENLIRTPQAAREHWTRHPHDGIGTCLEPSGLVSIDADYLVGARQVLAAEGIDLDALMATTPTIIGRAPRLEFCAPAGPLGRKAVVWPPRPSPVPPDMVERDIAVEMLAPLKEEARKRQETGTNQYSSLVPDPEQASARHGRSIEHAARIVGVGKTSIQNARATDEKPLTVIEFRGGRLQDVLPPSIHPDTHQPYRWLTPPRNGFPPLPDSLLALWQNFDAFRRRARNLCPWADPEPESLPVSRQNPRPRTGPSVIAEFNAAHDVVAVLEAHGYERAGKRRWKSPNGHGIAGVVVLPSGRVYCHHASDPLGDEKAHDAFDLFATLEHHGDVRAAVRAAAQLLKLDQERQSTC